VHTKTRLLLAGCVLTILFLFLSPLAPKIKAQVEGWTVALRSWQGGGEALPEIVVGDKVVLRVRCPAGGFTPWERGQLIIQRLKTAAENGVDPRSIVPGVFGGEAVVLAGDMLLVTCDRGTAEANSLTPTQLAYTWANNLRTSLGAPPLEQDDAYPTMARGRSLTARASWYGPGFHGRRTANGEIFDQNVFTAAHRDLPFGTMVLVTNPSNGKSVLVRINDRGPYVAGRSIDLSLAAARAIGMEEVGVADVKLTILS
jgi:hypothetical protein